MKVFKIVLFGIGILIGLTSCSSAQKLLKTSPISFGDAYCQSWVAGIQGGGSGINLFIPLRTELPKGVQLDSVYFRGQVTNLKRIEGNEVMYAAYFRTEYNDLKSLESNDIKEKKNHKSQMHNQEFPFELEDTECVVTFKKGIETMYFKIENITQKPSEHYPSAPPNKQQD
ncbi:MAG: hypothetical protein KDD03_07345 [Gelidibacter sp.]|nr:hypothetical protein [Gelidibacter sp.]